MNLRAFLGSKLGKVFSVCLLTGIQPLVAMSYDEMVGIKVKQLEKAAANAMRVQRTFHYPPEKLDAIWTSASEKIKIEESTEWDIDGDGKCFRITVDGINSKSRDRGIKELLQVRFAEPEDFLSTATGLSFWIKADESVNPNLRFGFYFKGNEKDPIIFTDNPVRHKFGDDIHKVYMDWGFVFEHNTGVFKTPKNDFWKAVEGFDLTFANRKLPFPNGFDQKSLEPVSASFLLDGLQLEDIYEGTYQDNRFKGKAINLTRQLVAQGRHNQVAKICAYFGGEAGLDSAVKALDMMVSLQSWDGSWPEERTRLQGEYTHGMILKDYAFVLEKLREVEHPSLKEEVTLRHFTGTREEIYETMLYRAAMSRAPGPTMNYNDTYIRGRGSMLSGSNRPMVYFVAQYKTAQVMSDVQRKAEIMAEYNKNVDELVTVQGITAGGWPSFPEGNAFKGKGLHFDKGYTIDHVFIMSYAYRITNDERWASMMRKFERVVKDLIMADGTHMDGYWNERKGQKTGGKEEMKIADIVHQEALRAGANYFAQWAYNTHKKRRAIWPTGFWEYTGRARGYPLGAFLTWNTYDLQLEPEPKDLGLVLPRQWPIHSVEWRHKDTGAITRLVPSIVAADGSVTSRVEWVLGEFPHVIGLPFKVVTSQDVAIQAKEYSGSLSALDVSEPLTISVNGDKGEIFIGSAYELNVNAEAEVVITAKDLSIQCTITPVKEGDLVKISLELIAKPF